MDKLVIEGGMRLRGEVWIDGAKNAALPALAATLLAEDREILLQNVPPAVDIRTMCILLEEMGARLETEGTSIRVSPTDLTSLEAPYDLVRKMRASVLTLGPMVARYGYAKVSVPGGCAIGQRPIDLHLAGLEAMGARITLHRGYVEARAKRLRGAEIHLDTPTVTGTENLLMAATLAEGRTRIENAAMEPEISDLAEFLRNMGAKIEGYSTPTMKIKGVRKLHGTNYTIIPDRVETGTYMIAGTIAGGEILLKNAKSIHLLAVIDKLRECGTDIVEEKGGKDFCLCAIS